MADLSPEAQAVLDATDYPEDWATRVRVAAARLQDNDLIFTATKHDKLISTRHAWVFYEILGIAEDGFSAAFWQRWLRVIAEP